MLFIKLGHGINVLLEHSFVLIFPVRCIININCPEHIHRLMALAPGPSHGSWGMSADLRWGGCEELWIFISNRAFAASSFSSQAVTREQSTMVTGPATPLWWELHFWEPQDLPWHAAPIWMLLTQTHTNLCRFSIFCSLMGLLPQALLAVLLCDTRSRYPYTQWGCRNFQKQ